VKRYVAIAVLATTAAISTYAPAKPAACHGAQGALETMARVDAHTLRLCWQSPDACFTLDLNAKALAWTPAAYPKSSPALGPASVIPGVTVGMTVSLCGTDGKDCRDFVVPPGPVDTQSDTYALANADRSLIAAVDERTTITPFDGKDCRDFVVPPGPVDTQSDTYALANADRSLIAAVDERTTITLFDGKGGKRGTIPSWKACTNCVGWRIEGIWFYGDRIYVEMTDGDHAETRMFDTKGAQIAELGDGGGVSRSPPLQLADGTIAVATAFGEKLDVRDKLGNRAKLIDVCGPVQSPQLDDRAVQVALTPDGHVAVARGDGSVASVNIAAGTHAELPPPPVCATTRKTK